MPLFLPLAKGVYERLGLPPAEVDRGLATLCGSPFPHFEAPVHPSVARYFGLHFITPQTRYRYYTGEGLTFVEYVERYGIRYEWNDSLMNAIAQAQRVERYDEEAEATIDVLKKNLEASSGSGIGYDQLARLQLLKGDTEATFTAMRQAVACDPDNPHYEANVAYCLTQRGELEEAELHLRALLRRWPNYAEGWVRLADVRDRRGNSPGVRGKCIGRSSLSGRVSNRLMFYVHVARRVGREDEAIEAFYDAVRIDPKNASLYPGLARVEAERGRFTEAVAQLDHAIRLDPENTGLLPHKVALLFGAGDRATAVATLTELINREPRNAKLHEVWTDLLMLFGRYEEAMEATRHVVTLDATMAPLPGQLAGRLNRAGRHAEAGQMYRIAIERDLNNVELLGGLGHASSRQGDIVGTVLAFRRAIQLGSKDPELYNRLAGLMIERGDLQDAEEIIDIANRVAPPDANVLATQALLLIFRGKFDTALVAVEQALMKAPNNTHFHREKGAHPFGNG